MKIESIYYLLSEMKLIVESHESIGLTLTAISQK